MNSEQNSARFTQGSVMRHVTVMSLTSSIGIMAIYVVDLLDIFFVSLLGHQEIAAAAGYASTLLFFVSAMNIGISVAAGALVARELGSDNIRAARDFTASAIALAVAAGIVVPLAMYPYLHFLVSLLGASGEVADLAVLYLRIILPATCLSGTSMVLVAALRARGEAKMAMYPSLAGAAVNLVFDPLLIFGLGMGLAGAAAATVLARLATFLLALHMASRRFNAVSRPDLRVIRAQTPEITTYALPSVLSSVAAPVGLAIMTRFMAKYGAEAVAGIAVAGRLAAVVFSVVSALSGAIGPIIGQNYGAGKIDRVRQAYRDALKFLAIYVALAVLVLFLLRVPIADAFGAQGKTRDLLLLFCGPFAVIAFFNGSLFISSAAFSNLGYPRYAPRLVWAKNTIGLLPFVAIGSYFFGMYGVVFGALFCAGLFAVISIRTTLGIIETAGGAQTEESALDYADEHEHRLVHQAEQIHT